MRAKPTYDELWQAYDTIQQELAASRKPRSGGCLDALVTLTVGLFVAALIYTYGPALYTQFTAPSPPAHDAPSAPQVDHTRPPSAVRSIGAELPSCSVVADTLTACVQDAPPVAAPPAPTEPPAPIPSATPEPAYTAACWTEIGQRPCWLPPDATWRPLEAAPETPLVLVEDAWHPPISADVCASWRAPAPYPDECS